MGKGRGVHALLLACALFMITVSPVSAQESSPCDCDLVTVTAVPPEYTIKGVPLVGQWWNLSCEFAATAAATGYFGMPLSQQMLLDTIGYDANPHKGFRGRISGPWGGTNDYGIYAEPIAEALHSAGFTGSYVFYGDEITLRSEIARAHPVVVWVTGNWRASTRYVQVSDGERYSLIPYEHAVTAYAYDKDGVWVMDPEKPSKYEVDWDTFHFAWSQFDQMALVVAR